MLKSVVVLWIILMLDGLNSEEFVEYVITDPWVVRFKFISEYSGNVIEIGGTFVHEHFVLTKARLFMDQNRQRKNVDFEVRTFRHKNLSNKNVTEMFVSEDYTTHPSKGDFDFDLLLIKFDLHYQHVIPVNFRKDYDMSKIKEVFFEEHRNLELLPKDRCYIDDNMCSTTIANRTVEDSYGAGLIYYDPELNDNFMIGILKSRFLEKATNTYIVNYFRMRDFADWILAHTADDTLTIENYCTKTDYTKIPKQLMKPRILTQGLINKFDWQVRIYNNVTQVACGGSLIKPDVVLTGSFCVKDENGNVNKKSYSLKFNNNPEWYTSNIVLNVQYCNDCYDYKHELINGADNIAMMYLTIQSTLKTITPIRMSNSKTFGELFQESFAHSAIVPAVRSIFEDGMPTFTVHRFISEKECSEIHPNVVGRFCTNNRQEFGFSDYDLGGGLIYCNEETGEPMLYGVLIEAKDQSKTYLHAYLGYYEKWIHF